MSKNKTVVVSDPPTTTPRFKTPYNARLFHPTQGEKNASPSLTIPDQTLTIREIVKRFANGLPVNGSNKVPMYEEHESEDTGFMPDPARMDPAEREEYVAAIDKQIQELNAANAKKQREQYEYARKQNEERIRKAAEAAVKQSWRPQDARRNDDPSTNFS